MVGRGSGWQNSGIEEKIRNPEKKFQNKSGNGEYYIFARISSKMLQKFANFPQKGAKIATKKFSLQTSRLRIVVKLEEKGQWWLLLALLT